MPSPVIREFPIAGPRGDGLHAYVNTSGAFIGRGVPLLERDRSGAWRPRESVALERLFANGYGASVELGWRATQLRYVAQALNNGNPVWASISMVRTEPPPLPSAAHACAMAKADGLLVKYNPDWEDEPRLPEGGPGGGEWTGDQTSGDADASVKPVADRVNETRARKERFVDAHLADAQKVADQLGVPVENILGISALESDWGRHPFAAQGNNYFGIHYPAPYATGYMMTADGKTKVATFASYADSLRSFAAVSGSIIRDVRDPSDFAAALQNSGKFGVNSTGTKVPSYVGSVPATIRGLRSIIARRRA